VEEVAKVKSKLLAPVDCSPVKTTDAVFAFKQVLQKAGASQKRDAVDLRIVDEVKTGKEQFGKSFEGGFNGIIDSQNDVGGWPELKTKKYPKDSDNDGLPDKWEKKNKLNPNDSSDNVKISIDKNYTNIEVYMNELANP